MHASKSQIFHGSQAPLLRRSRFTKSPERSLGSKGARSWLPSPLEAGVWTSSRRSPARFKTKAGARQRSFGQAGPHPADVCLLKQASTPGREALWLLPAARRCDVPLIMYVGWCWEFPTFCSLGGRSSFRSPRHSDHRADQGAHSRHRSKQQTGDRLACPHLKQVGLKTSCTSQVV